MGGVCCNLDTHIMRLEDERILDSKSHGRAIGVISDTFDDAVKASEYLKDKGYSILPMAEYPDKYRNFVVYILKK